MTAPDATLPNTRIPPDALRLSVAPMMDWIDVWVFCFENRQLDTVSSVVLQKRRAGVGARH